eukprot:2210144-Alexandrium_andersonii.AAC.1
MAVLIAALVGACADCLATVLSELYRFVVRLGKQLSGPFRECAFIQAPENASHKLSLIHISEPTRLALI